MERFRAIFKKSSTEKGPRYQLLNKEPGAIEDQYELRNVDQVPFSRFLYTIFALLGVAMLWVWHTLIVAAPYFQNRFSADPWITANFQSMIVSTWTPTNLLVTLIFTLKQREANYTLRILAGLLINVTVPGVLALSTRWWPLADLSPSGYLAVLLPVVAAGAAASGLLQNGIFAFAASFGRPEYTRALLAGQGIAGVLPPIVEVASVTATRHSRDKTAVATFYYFLTAVVASAAALVAFVALLQREPSQDGFVDKKGPVVSEKTSRTSLGLANFSRKTWWLAGTLFWCFVVTISSPVLTAKVQSVNKSAGDGSISDPAVFIPVAFLVWDIGDLAGRIATALPLFSWARQRHPAVLLAIAAARTIFLPMYLLCNFTGNGAMVPSDAFYMLVVQLPFGFSHGWLDTTCWVVSSEWVEENEREAVGSFLGLALVTGLAVGSLLSFAMAGL